MIEKHSTGAATLLISMLAKAATSMFARRTVLGVVPALLSTNVAIRLSILHLDSAAARVKPPRSNIITGDHMEAKMYLAARSESNLSCGGSSFVTTLRTTQRNGTIREVTNRGIAYIKLIYAHYSLYAERFDLPQSPRAN